MAHPEHPCDFGDLHGLGGGRVVGEWGRDDIDASAAGTAVVTELLELGASDANLARTAHIIEIHLPIQARTAADALAKATRLVARSLDGEPVHDVTARVTQHPV